MNTWLDIEKRFRDISPSLSGVRLDHQWGDAGEYWRVAGGSHDNNFEQFEILASIAGQLLEKSLPKNDPVLEKIVNEESYENRWYRAVWELTNKIENYTFGIMKNDNDEKVGQIHSAMIFNVVNVSANLCLRLHALYPIKEVNTNIPSINISGGTFGILNAGTIEETSSISINISSLREMGHEQLATAIEKLIKALEISNEINNSNKQEIIEQLSELSNQAIQPPEKRLKTSVIKSLTSSLATSLSVASDLAQLWSVCAPIITTHFLSK